MTMAVAILTNINPISFSYEFQYLEFSTDSPEVYVALSSDGNELLSGTYVPDSAGLIKIYDLNEVIDNHIGNAPFVELSLYLCDADGNDTFAVSTILRSSVAYNTTAAEFVSSYFLTSHTGTRYTAQGRYECLNFFATEQSPVTVEYWHDAGNGIAKKTKTLMTQCDQGINMIDVSLHKIAGYDAVLEYTVKCGARSQRYVVSKAFPADPAVAYRNRFNVWDTFYFTGTKESDPQFERSQAWVNGQYLTYNVKEVMQFKAMTGILPEGAEEYLHDIARSPEIRLLDSRGAMRDLLTVMDCDLKAVNDDNALNRLTITYRHADKVSAKSFAPVSTRIFDNSFDNSYE